MTSFRRPNCHSDFHCLRFLGSAMASTRFCHFFIFFKNDFIPDGRTSLQHCIALHCIVLHYVIVTLHYLRALRCITIHYACIALRYVHCLLLNDGNSTPCLLLNCAISRLICFVFVCVFLFVTFFFGSGTDGRSPSINEFPSDCSYREKMNEIHWSDPGVVPGLDLMDRAA
jgi:hypothetical protein